MIIEIIGFKAIKTNNKVEVSFKTGRKQEYDPEKTEHLILSGVEEIKIQKNEK